MDIPGICPIDISKTDLCSFNKHLADCVILTHDHKLYLQQRPENWGSSAGCLTLFGGHVEQDETIMQALVRELNEETGALIDQKDVIFIDAVSEDWTKHNELVHIHFWHDKHNTITGCYEAEPAYYQTVSQALAHPKIMDYTKYSLLKCQQLNLI